MPEFLELSPPGDALNILLEHFMASPQEEEINSADSLGRVTYSPVLAPFAMPSFPRSTVDGYALTARDTFGAGESLPAYLRLVGEVPMGASPAFTLGPAECAIIHTGGMLPEGADAVVMVEYTQVAREDEVEVLRSVAIGENILKIGEDVSAGQEVIPAGIRIRSAEIGGLMALGCTRLSVARRPRVAILSSGDEVVAPEFDLYPGQVYDINSYTLSALVEKAGGTPVQYGIIADQAEKLLQTTGLALKQNDMVVITAGSSASERDLTANVINQLGDPGVLVHGVNVRPGKPTILAVCQGKVVIGLPGNPVSALVIASIFVQAVIDALLGLRHPRPRARLDARLSLNLSSQTGREDWVAVRLHQKKDGYQAEPVFGKSNLIFTLARADGLIRIPPQASGLEAGELVEVFLL